MEAEDKVDEQLMTVAEVSKYLQISPITLYRMASAKKIPHIKLGKNVRFKKPEIEKWLLTKSNT